MANIEIYQPGELPDEEFYSCRRLLYETSLRTQSSPSALNAGKISALPFAPDLKAAWREHATIFVSKSEINELSGFLIAFGADRIDSLFKIPSYKHKKALRRLLDARQHNWSPAYILDLLLVNASAPQNSALSGNISRPLFRSLFSAFSRSDSSSIYISI